MNPLANKIILITAGPTREPWDPVRYLTNPSTGSMGISLAQEFKKKNYKVILVLGPTHLSPPSRLQVVQVQTALDMAKAVRRFIRGAHVFLATAAVSDYRFQKIEPKKIKKGNGETISVTLRKNPDILAEVGLRKKKNKNRMPLIVGFSLETHNLKKHALDKLRRKNCDLMIGNSTQSFSSDQIQGLWIEKTGLIKKIRRQRKKDLAKRIVDWASKKLTPPFS